MSIYSSWGSKMYSIKKAGIWWPLESASSTKLILMVMMSMTWGGSSLRKLASAPSRGSACREKGHRGRGRERRNGGHSPKGVGIYDGCIEWGEGVGLSKFSNMNFELCWQLSGKSPKIIVDITCRSPTREGFYALSSSFFSAAFLAFIEARSFSYGTLELAPFFLPHLHKWKSHQSQGYSI